MLTRNDDYAPSLLKPITSAPQATTPAMGSILRDYQVLAHFQCPFEDQTSSSCSFNLLDKSISGKCPFGHSAGEPNREIPPYICINNLTNRCTNDIIGNRASNDWDTLPRCSDGFHPSLDELVDLEHLHQKMASCILSNDQQSKPSETSKPTDSESSTTKPVPHEDQCSICLESVLEAKRNFGLLEQCNHVFCAECIITWIQGVQRVGNRAAPNTRKCPMCRVEYGKIAICQRLPRTDSQKAKLFELVELARHSERAQSDSSNSSDDEERIIDIPEARDELRLRLIQQLFEAISSLDIDDDGVEVRPRNESEDQPEVD